MNAFLLIFSVLMNVAACSILRNDFCKKDVTCNADLYIFNGLCSVLSAITLLVVALVGGSLGVPSMYTVALGVIYGVATAVCAVMNMKALEIGPLSYTGVICSCSMIIPALSGLVLFGESITPGQYVGTALMLVSFVCAVDRSNDKAGTSLKWLLLCMACFVANGSVGVLQKIHQSSPQKDELGAFLVIAFVVSALFSFVLTAYYRRGGQVVAVLRPEKRRRTWLIIAISGIGFALCNQINMYLSGVMPSIIFFPVVNGAGMILSTAAGFILWKEKLSRRQWLGLLAGAVAMFLLGGVFF